MTTAARYTLPPISLERVRLPERSFVLTPLFPLTYREVAQAWRRLLGRCGRGRRRSSTWRPPWRAGAAGAWPRGSSRCRGGATTARLLLLIDRQGSMAPFHAFVAEVRAAMLESGRLEDAAVAYFHDVPAEGADPALLDEVADRLFPAFDPILAAIPPLTAGDVFADEDLLQPTPLAELLAAHAAGSSVVLISDAGAARGRFDAMRLLDTVAFLKAVPPLAAQRCLAQPTAAGLLAASTCQVARHVPMFSLDRDGVHDAVNVLRGQVYSVERPL